MNHHRISRRIGVRQILLGLALALPVLIQSGTTGEAAEVPGRLVNGVCQPVADPAVEPRHLEPVAVDQVIQLTYDRNGDRVPDPFDLRSIDVLQGPLNVGFMLESGAIGVYRNLTAGFRWILPPGEVVRVTLEASGDLFTVDNIAIVRPGVSEPACTIDFDSQASLRAIGDAPFEFASTYSQCDVLVRPSPSVFPPDPRLGGGVYDGYELVFEDPAITFCEPPPPPWW